MSGVRILIFIFSSGICLTSFSQHKSAIFSIGKDRIVQSILNDSTHFQLVKKNALKQFMLEGYVGIELTDSVSNEKEIHLKFKAERKFDEIVLINTQGSNKNRYHENYKQVIKGLNSQLKNLENSGYPFAEIDFVKQRSENEKLFIEYKIDSGDYFIVDKVIIKSTKKFNENTVLNLVNLKPGEEYNESELKLIPEYLSLSGFYRLVQPVQLVFYPGKATVYLFIEPVNSSSADGYVGLQQDPNSGSLALNGYVNLSLNNAFQRATESDINWRNNPDKTQLLKFNLKLPYLFKSPLAFKSNIDLQKQDTSFIRSKINLGVAYQAPNFSVGFFSQFERSDLLVESLVGFRPYQKNTYGIEGYYQPILADKFNFYRPKLIGSIGFFSYVDDTLQAEVKNPLNLNFTYGYSHEIKLNRYFYLHNGLTHTTIYSETTLAENELNYFGGLRTVRGFYELELVGNKIYTLNNDLTFRPIKDLGLKLIYDYSRFSYKGEHYTHSVGLGFDFTAGNSILELVIANGTLDNNPFLLTNTKIHLGFKSSF